MAEEFGKYVGILGDPACRAGWQKNFPRIAELLRERYQPSHVFVPGDVSQYGLVAQHEETLEHCRKFPWQWVVAMGDHDRPVYIFERYWGPPKKVTDLGRWRFIGVNTADGIFTEENANWLREQMKNDTIIYSHMPPYLPGWEFHSLSKKCTARFFAVLDDFRDQVRACFFGHIHSYDRKEYHGTPLIVTGAGGASARGLGPDGYHGTRPYQAMAFDTTTGEIHLLEDKEHHSG
ncbi:MAG: metallophosphoesterase [Thermodesulfobacteriota bacterium]|nr:metallophosphoesterase [Thermodesulfobacteriota bacterium]